MKTLGVAGLSGFGFLISSMAGMPWQGLLAYSIIAALLTAAVAFGQLVVALAQVLVPQESHDKVLWLDKLLKRKTVRRERPSSVTRPEPVQVSVRPGPAIGGKPVVRRQRKPAAKRRPRPARSP